MEVNTQSTYYVTARRPRKDVTRDSHRRNAADGPDATCNSPNKNVNRKYPIPPFHHGNHNKSEDVFYQGGNSTKRYNGKDYDAYNSASKTSRRSIDRDDMEWCMTQGNSYPQYVPDRSHGNNSMPKHHQQKQVYKPPEKSKDDFSCQNARFLENNMPNYNYHQDSFQRDRIPSSVPARFDNYNTCHAGKHYPDSRVRDPDLFFPKYQDEKAKKC